MSPAGIAELGRIVGVERNFGYLRMDTQIVNPRRHRAYIKMDGTISHPGDPNPQEAEQIVHSICGLNAPAESARTHYSRKMAEPKCRPEFHR